MNGLQTIQKINDAQIAIAQARSKTPVADTVEGFFVFYPHGYEVAYHTEHKLPQEGRAHLTVEFKGDLGINNPRFDITPAKGPTACNRSLEEVIQLAEQEGLDGTEVGTRLAKLFVSDSNN